MGGAAARAAAAVFFLSCCYQVPKTNQPTMPFAVVNKSRYQSLKEKYCSIGMPSTFNDHDYPARNYLIGDSVPSSTEDYQFPANEGQGLLVMYYPVHSANHNDIERVWAFFRTVLSENAANDHIPID